MKFLDGDFEIESADEGTFLLENIAVECKVKVIKSNSLTE